MQMVLILCVVQQRKSFRFIKREIMETVQIGWLGLEVVLRQWPKIKMKFFLLDVKMDGLKYALFSLIILPFLNHMLKTMKTQCPSLKLESVIVNKYWQPSVMIWHWNSMIYLICRNKWIMKKIKKNNWLFSSKKWEKKKRKKKSKTWTSSMTSN